MEDATSIASMTLCSAYLLLILMRRLGEMSIRWDVGLIMWYFER